MKKPFNFQNLQIFSAFSIPNSGIKKEIKKPFSFPTMVSGVLNMRKGLPQSPNHQVEGKIYRKALYLRVKTGKTLVSYKESPQPIH